jgi:penicillin-binding protein 2
MIDVIQSGTGRGIRTPLYQIAGKTGTAQVKSIAQGKRYNEAALSERQLDHGLFVGFAPADKPEIAIAVIWENGRHGGSAAQLAKPVFDYWLLTRKKNPIRPANHQVNGGLMTAGIKPGELPSGSEKVPARLQQAAPTNQQHQHHKLLLLVLLPMRSMNNEKSITYYWRRMEKTSFAFRQY